MSAPETDQNAAFSQPAGESQEQVAENGEGGAESEEVQAPPEINEEYLHKLPNALQTDFDAIEDKPWLQEGANMSDWFNYGFDEEMFKVYQQKVRDNYATIDREAIIKEVKEKRLDLNHENINFYLPHEAGGVGAAKSQEYLRVNTYRVAEDDAPVLCNKSQGYFVKIIKNGLQNLPENMAEEGEGDMTQFPPGMIMHPNMMEQNAAVYQAMMGQMGMDMQSMMSGDAMAQMMQQMQNMPMMPGADGRHGDSRRKSKSRNNRYGRRRENKAREKQYDDGHLRPEPRGSRDRSSRSKGSRYSPNKDRRDDRRRSSRDRDHSRRSSNGSSHRDSDRRRDDRRHSDRSRNRDYERKSDSRRDDRSRNDRRHDDRRRSGDGRSERRDRDDRRHDRNRDSDRRQDNRRNDDRRRNDRKRARDS